MRAGRSVARGLLLVKHRGSRGVDQIDCREAGADASRRLRRQRSSQRRNGANEDETEKRTHRQNQSCSRCARREQLPIGGGRGPPAPVATPRHSDAGRGRRHAPPAESNYIVFSVRPPLAPFLRCELRSLRPLRTWARSQTDSVPDRAVNSSRRTQAGAQLALAFQR